MKTFYKYIFEKELLKIDKDELLSAFEQNFIRSGCYHKIIRIEDGLDLNNDFQDFNYFYKMVGPWNLWNGIGEIKIRIIQNLSGESYLIRFSISILRPLVIHALELLIFSIILISIYTTGLLIVFIIINAIIITSYFTLFARCKRFFFKTIKVGDYYKDQVLKSYDWDKILAKKTNSDLIDFIRENSHLPDIVIELAKKELENRNVKN